MSKILETELINTLKSIDNKLGLLLSKTEEKVIKVDWCLVKDKLIEKIKSYIKDNPILDVLVCVYFSVIDFTNENPDYILADLINNVYLLKHKSGDTHIITRDELLEELNNDKLYRKNDENSRGRKNYNWMQ